MRSYQPRSHSRQRVLPLLGGLLLLCLFFVLHALAAAPAAAAGEFIRVPGDAGTIQAAIDLAADGAEIRVQGGNYAENLVITRSLRLSGSWTGDWSQQDKQAPTILDASGLGRAITIRGNAAVTPSVVISYFAITGGSANGLGGAVTPTVAGLAAALPQVRNAAPDARPLAEQAATLRAGLAALAAEGQFPGGQAALDALLARADGTGNQNPPLDAPEVAGLTAAAATAAGEIDCGGGIYVNGAALHLLTVNVSESIAAAAGPGAGGGLCAVRVPSGGLLLERVTLGDNFGSQAGIGYGGGLFFDGGATPTAGALRLDNVRIDRNAASESGWGYGGGAFITAAPAAQLHLAMFGSNYASLKGVHGYGGGVYLNESRAVQMNLVGFERNTSVNLVLFASDDWPIGEGGALYVRQSPELTITSPGGSEGDSLFVGNLAALHGVGFGGALAVRDSTGLHVERTTFLGNWAAIYPDGGGDTISGGAMHLVSAGGARIISSTFANNLAGVFNLGGDRMYGGALAANTSNDLALAGNRWEENSCGASSGGGLAHGGAVDIIASDFVTITGNAFTGNAADLGLAGGFGGALHLQLANDVLLAHNRFERNRGGAGAGIGGAVTIEGSSDGAGFAPWESATGAGAQGMGDPLSERVAIIANTFLSNQGAANAGGEQANLGGALAFSGVNGLALANNVLANNEAQNGAALALFGWDREAITVTVAEAAVVNNTLFANAGDSGVYIESWTTPITLTNNIVVSHTVGIAVADNRDQVGSVAGARYNLYNDNAADSVVDPDSTLIETGGFTGSVRFVEPWQGDFRLLPSSAAVDGGDPAGIPPAPAVDIEDTPRPFGPRVDVGAFEWHGPAFYLPGIMKEACHTQPVEGWAMGEAANSSTILHTADGGLTWTRQYTSTVLLNGLAIGDRLHLWITGDNGAILHSADGGATWQKQQPPAALPSTASIGRITAVDANTAWAAAQSGDHVNNTAHVINTTDGGATWSVQFSFATGPGWINWIDAADANNIWAVGGTSAALGSQRAAAAAGDGYIYHSADGGRTWRLELNAPAGSVIGVDAVSANVAWAAGRQGAYRTLDGGTTWEFLNLVAMADLNHVDSIAGEQVWLSGDAFVVPYTDKGLAQPLTSKDWQDRRPSLGAKVAYTVDFIDAKNGWIAGGTFGGSPGGVVARTCDGGINWEISEWDDFDPIRTIQMAP